MAKSEAELKQLIEKGIAEQRAEVMERLKGQSLTFEEMEQAVMAVTFGQAPRIKALLQAARAERNQPGSDDLDDDWDD